VAVSDRVPVAADRHWLRAELLCDCWATPLNDSRTMMLPPV
jgi:hypothetical protein